MVGSNRKLIAVVKAAAYEHGGVKIPHFLIDQGVELLAVATVEKAIELRRIDT
jgi:alanine racemase